MTDRINITQAMPDLYQSMRSLAEDVAKTAANAGVDKLLVELVKIRASQLNGCAYCLDLHNADAVRLGEDPRRLFVLAGWRETELFTEQERAALEVTEHVTRLSQTQDLPDDVYERATAAFTDDQYSALLWLVVVINSWNRIAVPSHTKLPRRAR